MPEAFKKEYPNTRIIIGATEFSVERSSSLVVQACTFSAYKNKNTVKVLIGVTPSGAMSEEYEGSISDKKLVEVSGLLHKLEPDDEIMADKGFTIQDLLIPYGVRLKTPPFLQKNTQMAANDVFMTCLFKSTCGASYWPSQGIQDIAGHTSSVYVGLHKQCNICLLHVK